MKQKARSEFVSETTRFMEKHRLSYQAFGESLKPPMSGEQVGLVLGRDNPQDRTLAQFGERMGVKFVREEG